MPPRDQMLTPLPNAKPHIFAAFRDRRLGAGVRAFQKAASNGQFPAADESVSIEPAELESFLLKLEQ